MSLLIELVANVTPAKLRGLELKYWFGLIQLAIASALAAAQVWISIHPPPPVVDPDKAKKTLDEVAEKVTEAANKATEAAEKAEQAVENLRQGDIHTMSVAAAAQAGQDATAAKDAADDARAAASEASEAAAAASSSFLGIANTVAAKLPLLGGALLFALLGCAVAGFINVSFG